MYLFGPKPKPTILCYSHTVEKKPTCVAEFWKSFLPVWLDYLTHVSDKDEAYVINNSYLNKGESPNQNAFKKATSNLSMNREVGWSSLLPDHKKAGNFTYQIFSKYDWDANDMQFVNDLLAQKFEGEDIDVSTTWDCVAMHVPANPEYGTVYFTFSSLAGPCGVTKWAALPIPTQQVDGSGLASRMSKGSVPAA